MDLASLGARTRGVWTRADALALVGPGSLRGALTTGLWQVVWPGVYADAGYVLDAHQRAYAAVLASGGAHHLGGTVPVHAAACGRTAARVWRMPLVDDHDPSTGAFEAGPDEVQVATRSRPLRHRGRTLHRHRSTLRPGDLRRLRSGLVLTSPLRTLVDGASLLNHEALVCAVDDALRRGLVRREELDDEVRRRAGCAGARSFRAAVAAADGRAESPAETLARLLLLPVLPGLVPQVQLRQWGQVVARLDLGDPVARFAVEVDGKRGHAGTQMVARDRRRDRRTAELGWATERVTWHDLRRAPAATVRRVVAAHAAHVRLAA